MKKWKLDDQLCFLLYASSRNIIRSYKDILDQYGLTYPQYITLVALWEEDHVLVSELGTRLQLDSGTLSPLLKKLEKDGRITKERDQLDQRKVYITLTKAGRDLGEVCQNVPRQMIENLKIEHPAIKDLYYNLKTVYEGYLKGE